jgi:hypothetical protein
MRVFAMMLGLALSICTPSSSGEGWAPCVSPNGNEYETIRKTTTAAYHVRDGSRLLWFLDQYWLLGGWDTPAPAEWGQQSTNEVWSSPDLITWTLELAHVASPPTSGAGARWRPRHAFGAVVFDGYMWVVGTDWLDAQGWLSDVWRSADGVTWERVAASSPWGPAVFPIVVVYDGRIHVLGGYKDPGEDIFASVSSAQHWSTADGVAWTEHDDMPFTRAATDAVVQCEKLLIFAGSEGDPYSARTFPTDTWAWNGTEWHEQSADSGGVWEGRDWAATAAFDDKIWLLTGVTDDPVDPPENLGDAQWSEDLGATWTKIYAPWNATHAAAAVTSPDGLAHLAGVNQGQSTYLLVSETPGAPHAADLSGWWRAQYRGHTWRGSASAGDSEGRLLSEVGNPPGQSVSLNGFTVADFDGTNDVLGETELFLDSYITGTSWWVGMLVNADSLGAAAAAEAYDDDALITEQNGGWGIAINTSGVRAWSHDGAFKKTPHVAASTGTWFWVEGWLSGGTLSVSVNGGTAQTVGSVGTLGSLGSRAMRIGQSWDGTNR